MRTLFGALLALALSACGGGSGESADAGLGKGPLLIDGKTIYGGVGIQARSYDWSTVRTPVAGHDVYKIVTVPGSSDVWMLGRKIERWNGSEITASFDLPPTVILTTQETSPGAMDSAAVFGPNDIWACGTALMHWDGTSWTVQNSKIGQPDGPLFNGCGIEGPSGGIAVINYDGLWTVDATGAVTHAYLSNQHPVSSSTGTAILTNTNNPYPIGGLGTNCAFPLPSGEIAVLGLGVLHPSASNIPVDVKFKTVSDCSHGRIGDTLYASGYANGFAALKSDLPAEVSIAGGVSSAQVDAAQLSGFGGAAATAVVAFPDRAVYAFFAGDDQRIRSTWVFVEAANGTATLLEDRLYGYKIFDAAPVGNDMLVAVQGGGILKAVRR